MFRSLSVVGPIVLESRRSAVDEAAPTEQGSPHLDTDQCDADQSNAAEPGGSVVAHQEDAGETEAGEQQISEAPGAGRDSPVVVKAD